MTKPATSSTRLSLEPLADRLVPTVFLSNGEIYVVGTENRDVVEVTVAHVGNSNYEVRVKENGVTTPIPLSQVTGRLIFYGYGGDDYLSSYTGLRVYADGGQGNDTLMGGWANDYIIGGNGADNLVGREGHDTLTDQGTDYVGGYLYGGHGNDVLYGSNGHDTIYGENGTDTLAGLDGNDYLDGGYANDYIFGHGGHDYMEAGLDYDWNYMDGGDGQDSMYGGYGIDYMHGGNDADRLEGRAGDDDLNGGDDGAHDRLYGGAGNDWFQLDYYYSGGRWLNRDNQTDFGYSGTDHWYNA